MSGHSSYQPSNGVEKWIDARLPLPRLMYDSFVSYPVPRNLNYAYTFGGMLSIMLIVQILTGVVLAMHYAAETTVAFNSVEKIMRDVNHGWLLRYMHAASEACRGGVNRVHIISYARDGALLQELFTRDGSGTLITHDPYEEIREAEIEDIGGMIELLRPLEEDGILVRRSRERLEMEINHFVVIERDGMIVGCAALYPLPSDEKNPASGEIACVAVHPNYRKGDRGSELLEYLEKRAASKGLRKLFVLTTRTALWFIEHGFTPASVDDLPVERKALYNFQRNSQVFSKSL